MRTTLSCASRTSCATPSDVVQAVGGVEIDSDRGSRGDAQLRMTSRDVWIGEDEVAVGRAPDGHDLVADSARPRRSRDRRRPRGASSHRPRRPARSVVRIAPVTSGGRPSTVVGCSARASAPQRLGTAGRGADVCADLAPRRAGGSEDRDVDIGAVARSHGEIGPHGGAVFERGPTDSRKRARRCGQRLPVAPARPQPARAAPLAACVADLRVPRISTKGISHVRIPGDSRPTRIDGRDGRPGLG